MSKKISEESSDTSKIFGVIPYIDPKSFSIKVHDTDKSQKYQLSKESDVYSFGVLMWQISSGRPPFCEEDNHDDGTLVLAILNGKREKVVEETPTKYFKLYRGINN